MSIKSFKIWIPSGTANASLVWRVLSQGLCEHRFPYTPWQRVGNVELQPIAPWLWRGGGTLTEGLQCWDVDVNAHMQSPIPKCPKCASLYQWCNARGHMWFVTWRWSLLLVLFSTSKWTSNILCSLCQIIEVWYIPSPFAVLAYAIPGLLCQVETRLLCCIFSGALSCDWKVWRERARERRFPLCRRRLDMIYSPAPPYAAWMLKSYVVSGAAWQGRHTGPRLILCVACFTAVRCYDSWLQD